MSDNEKGEMSANVRKWTGWEEGGVLKNDEIGTQKSCLIKGAAVPSTHTRQVRRDDERRLRSGTKRLVVNQSEPKTETFFTNPAKETHYIIVT